LSWEGTILSIPNRIISEGNVENYNKARVLDSSMDIYLPPELDPTRMLALITECLPNISHMAIDGPDDEPKARYRGVVFNNGVWMARYKVGFFVRIVPKRQKVVEAVWLRLWPKLMAEGVQWVGINQGITHLTGEAPKLPAGNV
ncbi:MAG: mechanosensitive ion channel family protein, partial [Magnetococcales bacterium]|nr:mechanosensitive ion channel family protein [Magnetococcales bacterium]